MNRIYSKMIGKPDGYRFGTFLLLILISDDCHTGEGIFNLDIVSSGFKSA